jgi:hypothetical protein
VSRKFIKSCKIINTLSVKKFVNWFPNDFWVSRLKFLTRTNYLPLNERLFKINLRESSKCNMCDDDIVEDLHHFLFECKTLPSTHDSIKIARSFIILHNSFVLNWSSEKPSSVLKLRQKSYSRRLASFLIWMQNLAWYQTRTIRRNRNSNKIVLSESRVFRATALSKRTFMEINFRKMFIQGQVIGSS